MSSSHEKASPHQEKSSSHMGRRAFLRLSAGTAGFLALAAAFPDQLRSTAAYLGGKLDRLQSVEELGFVEQSILSPRSDQTPSVAPDQRLHQFQELECSISAQAGVPQLRFVFEGLYGQFSHNSIQAGSYTFAGASVVTTREGLTHGKQEFAAIFRTANQTVAVGYETGSLLYLDQTANEWEVVLVTEDTEQLQVARLKIWQELVNSTYFTSVQGVAEMLEFGTQAQTRVGYEPFAGVLPDTKMPLMKQVDLSEKDFAQNLEQALAMVLNTEQRPMYTYYVTEQGAMLDLTHVAHKARMAAQWYVQLRYFQEISKQKNYQESAHLQTGYYYQASEDVVFKYAVTPDQLQRSLSETMLKLIVDFTYRTEGILQLKVKFLARAAHIPEDKFDMTGFSPEDAYSNAVGTQLAYELCSQPEFGISQRVEQVVAQLVERNAVISPQELSRICDEVFNFDEWGMRYLEQVVRLLYTKAPCRTFAEHLTELPLGFYSFIPTLVSPSEKSPSFPIEPPTSTAGIQIEQAPLYSVIIPDAVSEYNKLLRRVFSGVRAMLGKS